MSSPLKLFWWNKAPNFGDGMSPDIAAYVSGRAVEWAGVETCELVGIGSVMLMVAGAIRDKLGPRKTIWGSGLFGPAKRISDFADSDHVRVASVRGPLSAIFAGYPDARVGDPGLLADRVYGRIEKRYRIGVVPHHSQWNKKDFIVPLREDRRIHLIDVRRHIPGDAVREIAACEYILSGSLHGLVVADAYGIPNFWLHGPALVHSDLKFGDYALSVGRSLQRPIPFEECLRRIERRDFAEFWYLDRLEGVKDGIEAAFPADLTLAAMVA